MRTTVPVHIARAAPPARMGDDSSSRYLALGGVDPLARKLTGTTIDFGVVRAHALGARVDLISTAEVGFHDFGMLFACGESPLPAAAVALAGYSPRTSLIAVALLRSLRIADALIAETDRFRQVAPEPTPIFSVHTTSPATAGDRPTQPPDCVVSSQEVIPAICRASVRGNYVWRRLTLQDRSRERLTGFWEGEMLC